MQQDTQITPRPIRPSGRQLGVVVRRALFGVGPVATGRALIRRVLRSDRGPDRPQASFASGLHPFDEEHGIDCGGFHSWRELQSGGANDPYISGYLGVAPSVARLAFGFISEPESYTAIDLGCGKGRALVVASERPFRRVIGVEIVAQLADSARRNAAAIRTRLPNRTPIEIVHGDAATFMPPPGPFVLFMYQPFETPVMRKVARNLQASLSASPRFAVVVYLYPALARSLDKLPALERLHEVKCRPSADEVPYTYAGEGGTDQLVLWGTRDPRPTLRLT